MGKRLKPTYEKEVQEKVKIYSELPPESKDLSDKNYSDLLTYNAMIDEWANGLLSLKLKRDEVNIKTINQKKKKFYWIHWKRGTKGIKHYANMMLERLEREQKEKYQAMQKEGEQT